MDVGKVTGLQREGDTGLVSMEIENKGLPIHADATLKIRPRIFLEGNWFVELQPGSPSVKTLSSGATIPITQTSDPVQLDQVLDALNTDTRTNLQNFLQGYGDALTREPTAAENAEQDPDVLRPERRAGAEQVHPSRALGAARLGDCPPGDERHRSGRPLPAVASIGKVTAALNVHEEDLSELFGNFDAFFRNFAVQSSSLDATVAVLPSSLRAFGQGFAALDRALPPTRTFSLELIPGVKLLPSTIAASLPWIEQVQASLAPSELGGVAKGLLTATPALAKLFSEQPAFFEQTNAFSKCLTKVFYPAGNTKIQDGPNTSGVEAYKEFFYTLTGLAGLGQTFDGNGVMDRFLVGGGGTTFRSAPVAITGTSTKGGLSLIARAPLAPEGTRPAFPAKSRRISRWCPATRRRRRTSMARLSQGPADGSGG